LTDEQPSMEPANAITCSQNKDLKCN